MTAPAPPAALRRGLRSDNESGLCREAREALLAADDGAHHPSYGDDAATSRAVEAFRALFGDALTVAFVPTGTAANVLAFAALCEPWEQVLAHEQSHVVRHESTAPERLAGVRVRALGGAHGRIDPEALDPLPLARDAGDVHAPQPGVLTLTNATELGTVYTPEQLRALCDRAHARGYRVHVDGARFANAVAALGCAPRALGPDAGVDALSFGGTKNGLALGEALLLFSSPTGASGRSAAQRLAFLRKASGHLLSKQRFVSAPFAAVLESGAWLAHAAHANAMARRLADGLSRAGLEPRHPVETNAVFVDLPDAADAALQQAGYGYHRFGEGPRAPVRLMCSFDTRAEEIDHFVALTARALSG